VCFSANFLFQLSRGVFYSEHDLGLSHRQLLKS
jgi:hypothetical protein